MVVTLFCYMFKSFTKAQEHQWNIMKSTKYFKKKSNNSLTTTNNQTMRINQQIKEFISGSLVCSSGLVSLTDPSLPWLTLCDLLLGSVQMELGGDLSDHDQRAMVSGCSSLPNTLLRLSSLQNLHGNCAAAAGGCWALLHLHDNCIQSTMTARVDRWAWLFGWRRG